MKRRETVTDVGGIPKRKQPKKFDENKELCVQLESDAVKKARRAAIEEQYKELDSFFQFKHRSELLLRVQKMKQKLETMESSSDEDFYGNPINKKPFD